MRFSAILPLLCAIAAFVLSMLCLFAGNKPGFMEDYHIITLNTSILGHVIVPTTTSSGAQASSTSAGSWLLNTAKNLTSDIKNEIEDELVSIEGDVADKLAEKLGIYQWYSLHLMDMCMGMFAPNATAQGAGKNISRCTNATAMYQFDPTSEIQAELNKSSIGSKISLADLNWPEDIQNGINAVNGALAATFVVYCIGIAVCGLAIIFSLIAIFLNGARLLSFFNFGLAVLAFLALAIASALITAVMVKGANVINEFGNDAGVYAYKGGGYLALTWAATGIMLLASIFWIAECCVGRRARMREYTEKPI